MVDAVRAAVEKQQAVEAPDAGIGVVFAPEHMCRN
jgi:hypothetical protein